MSDLLANNVRVLSGRIQLPRVGAWIADLALDTEDTGPFLGAVTITAPAGDLELRGWAMRPRLVEGHVEVRIVGGRGGLAKNVTPRHYRNVTLQLALSDALGEGLETLSTSVAASIREQLLPAWTRRAQTVGGAIAMLAGFAGAGWRVLPDGTVWVGTETWSDVDVDHDLLVETQEDLVEIASDTIPASLVPGTTFRGARVSVVEHVIESQRVRTVVTFERAGASSDRRTEAVFSIVNQAVARVDYFALYPARVVQQGVDGTLELTPDDVRLPGMSGVPIWYGVPGVTATVPAGARVLISWAGGDPRLPHALLWEPGSTTSISIDTTGDVVVNNGALKVARVTDPTTGHAHAAGALVAGPYAVTGVSASQTDTIAAGAGASRFKA